GYAPRTVERRALGEAAQLPVDVPPRGSVPVPAAVLREGERLAAGQLTQNVGPSRPIQLLGHRCILLAHLRAVLVEPLLGRGEAPQVGVVERPVQGGIATHRAGAW